MTSNKSLKDIQYLKKYLLEIKAVFATDNYDH